MAFQLYNWSEVSVSLNQGLVSAAIQTETSDTVVQQGAQNVFCYFSPTDTIATISASNYFNGTLPNSVLWSVQVGDMIFVEGEDYNQILEITTVTLPVAGSSGTINTSVWGNNSLIQSVTTTTLTNAQLLGMYATPVLLIPAQGAGTMILLDKMVVDYHYLTASTASGGAIQAQYGATVDGAGPAASASIAAATLNGFAGNAIMTVGSVAVSQLDAAVENVGIYLSNATGAFTTGAGSAIVYSYYRVISPA